MRADRTDSDFVADRNVRKTGPKASPVPRTLTAEEWQAFERGWVYSLPAATHLARGYRGRDIDDLLSTARVKMIDALTRAESPMAVPETEERFRATFLTILRNAARDEYRRWDPRNDGEYRATALDAAPAEEDGVMMLGMELVWEAVHGVLTKRQAEVFVQTYCFGRSRDFVVSFLRIGYKTYDSHLTAAVAKVRKALIERVDEDPDLPPEMRTAVTELARRFDERRKARKRAVPPVA
jgi:DNA-directed RNA polymerase specialized sigma24 family protein